MMWSEDAESIDTAIEVLLSIYLVSTILSFLIVYIYHKYNPCCIKRIIKNIFNKIKNK